MKFPSRLLFGLLGDRLAVRSLTAVLFAMEALGLAVLVLAPGWLGALVFAIIFGAAIGAVTTARPALLAEIYGRANYAAISGAMTASGVVARAAAPVGIGLLYDASGTYVPVLWGLVALSLVALAAVLATRASTAPVADATAAPPSGVVTR
jgi:MFS family permease